MAKYEQEFHKELFCDVSNAKTVVVVPFIISLPLRY